MSDTLAPPAPRWRLHLPDPGRGWARYEPAVWPAAHSWLDVPGERWGSSGGRVPFPPDPAPPAHDVLWLPPVPAERGAERDAWAASRVAEGTPVVVQVAPGERVPEGCLAAFDLSEVAIARGTLTAEDLAAGGVPYAALWPVLPGIVEDCAQRRRVFEAVAAAKVPRLLVVRPELRPADRRALAQRVGEERYGAVFHGEAGSRRAVAREARACGLEPFPARPARDEPDLLVLNRRVAEVFGLLGELWHRLGKPAESGQALFAAMRAADRLPQSLEHLRAEGNLPVLPWLDEPRRAIVEEVLATGGSLLCDTLLDEYAGPRPR